MTNQCLDVAEEALYRSIDVTCEEEIDYQNTKILLNETSDRVSTAEPVPAAPSSNAFEQPNVHMYVHSYVVNKSFVLPNSSL